MLVRPLECISSAYHLMPFIPILDSRNCEAIRTLLKFEQRITNHGRFSLWIWSGYYDIEDEPLTEEFLSL